MKKIILVLAAAVIAVGFVFGLQWYEQYKIATFIEQQGPTAARQTMERFGSLFGRDARLEMGKVSAGMDSVTIENPVLVCDGVQVQRITAAKAVLTAVEMHGDFSAIIRMDLALYGVKAMDGDGMTTMRADELRVGDLRLEDNDPFPDVLAQSVTYNNLYRKLDYGTLETKTGSSGPCRLSQAKYLIVEQASMGDIAIHQERRGRATVATIARTSFKNLHQPLGGFDSSFKDLKNIKLLLSESQIDDVTIEQMHVETPGNKGLDYVEVAKTVLSATYKDETVRYQLTCGGVDIKLQDSEETKAYEQFLSDLGYGQTLVYNFSINAALGLGDNILSLKDLSFWADGVGKISLAMVWNKVDYETIFNDSDDEEFFGKALLSGFELTYTDNSLVNSLKRYYAKSSGTSVLAINAQLMALTMAGKVAIEDPVERKLMLELAHFGLNPGTISFRFKPKEPIPFEELGEEERTKSDLEEKLKQGEITVTYTPPPGAEKEKP